MRSDHLHSVPGHSTDARYEDNRYETKLHDHCESQCVIKFKNLLIAERDESCFVSLHVFVCIGFRLGYPLVV